MKIFLDDERPAFNEDWTIVRNVGTFAHVAINNWNKIEALSFDNDLGSILEGYDAAKWFFKAATKEGWPPKLTHIYIHSGNAVAKDNIKALFTNRFAPDNLVVEIVDPPIMGKR